MPENTVSSDSAIITHGLPLKKQQRIDANWLRLPYELWLTVLVDYGVSAADLVCLEYSAKWFSNGWGGMSICTSLKFPPMNKLACKHAHARFILCRRISDRGSC